MVYLVEATYPGTKATEIGKHFIARLQEDPMPGSVKIRDIYAFAGGDGFRVLMFYDIEDNSVKESTDWIGRAVVNFLQTFDGYKAIGRIVYTMEEAFAFIDMQAPAV